MIDHDFHFGFPFIEEKKPNPIRLTSVGIFTDWEPGKIYDNSIRPIYTYMFIYTIAGAGIIQYGDRTRCVNKNDACLMFMPSDSKYYSNPESKEKWRYLFIMFIVDKIHIKGYCNEIMGKTGGVFPLEPESKTVVSATNLIMKRRAGLISHYLLANAAAYDFISCLAYEVLEGEEKHSQLVDKSIQIMKNRFYCSEGIGDVARMLQVSPSHLSRVFLQEMGETPIKYLNKLRINYSISLLLETNYSIKKVAQMCGFSDQAYFTRIFKKHMGMAPKQYRVIEE